MWCVYGGEAGTGNGLPRADAHFLDNSNLSLFFVSHSTFSALVSFDEKQRYAGEAALAVVRGVVCK